MQKFYERLISTLELIFGVGSMLYGIGYALLALEGNINSSAISEVLVNPTVATLFCSGFILSGLMVLLGMTFKWNFLVAQGLFIIAIGQMFRCISIWLGAGFFQPSWIMTGVTFALATTLWIGRQLRPVVYDAS